MRYVEPAGFTKVSPLGVDEQRVFVIIDILSSYEQWSTLGDGFRVDVRIVTETVPHATIIPVSALFRRQSRWAAFVIEGGAARERPVHLLLRSGQLAALKSGLRVGEQVVMFPPSSLRDGMRVHPR